MIDIEELKDIKQNHNIHLITHTKKIFEKFLEFIIK